MRKFLHEIALTAGLTLMANSTVATMKTTKMWLGELSRISENCLIISLVNKSKGELLMSESTVSQRIADEIISIVERYGVNSLQLKDALVNYIDTKAQIQLVESYERFNTKEDVKTWIVVHSSPSINIEQFEIVVYESAKAFFATDAGRYLIRTIIERRDSNCGTWENIEGVLDWMILVRPNEYTPAIVDWFKSLEVNCYPFSAYQG